MKHILSLVLLSFTFSASAQSLQYIEIKCLSDIADDPREVFSGKLLATKLERSSSGISVEGRDYILTKKQINNSQCRNWQMVYEDYWDGTQWNGRLVRKNRDWNALVISQEPSQMLLFCHRSSVLTVFDSKEAFLQSIYKKYSADDGVNTISHRDCLVDEL